MGKLCPFWRGFGSVWQGLNGNQAGLKPFCSLNFTVFSKGSGFHKSPFRKKNQDNSVCVGSIAVPKYSDLILKQGTTALSVILIQH